MWPALAIEDCPGKLDFKSGLPHAAQLYFAFLSSLFCLRLVRAAGAAKRVRTGRGMRAPDSSIRRRHLAGKGTAGPGDDPAGSAGRTIAGACRRGAAARHHPLSEGTVSRGDRSVHEGGGAGPERSRVDRDAWGEPVPAGPHVAEAIPFLEKAARRGGEREHRSGLCAGPLLCRCAALRRFAPCLCCAVRICARFGASISAGRAAVSAARADG